ncbi:MAG: single-stranded-DNA-specific exonuclease, partial [Candidatus Omnitrophota bacterium]
MAKQWIFQDSNPKLQKELSDSLKISPIVAQVLINRGITNDDLAAQFLEPTEDNL